MTVLFAEPVAWPSRIVAECWTCQRHGAPTPLTDYQSMIHRQMCGCDVRPIRRMP